MDKITDFFKEFKNRVTNPLIFSFIVSWLIVNWKISVGFLMYNSETVNKLGYKTYYDLILDNNTERKLLAIPFLCALAYTFLFPPIRFVIVSFLSLFKKWTNNLNLYIMKDANVPMNRFIKETERSDKLAKTLEDLYKKDSTIQTQNQKLQSDINELKQTIAKKELTITQDAEEIHALNYKIEQTTRLENTGIINGMWNVTAKGHSILDKRFVEDNSDLDAQYPFLISIYNGAIQYVTGAMTPLDYGKIIGFAYNIHLNTAQVTFERYLFNPTNLLPVNTNGMTLTYQYLHMTLDNAGKIIEMKGTDELMNQSIYKREENIKIESHVLPTSRPLQGIPNT